MLDQSQAEYTCLATSYATHKERSRAVWPHVKKRENKVTIVVLKGVKSHNTIQKRDSHLCTAGREFLLDGVCHGNYSKNLLTVSNWDSIAPGLISSPDKLWHFTSGLVNRWLPKNHFQLLSNMVGDCIYFSKTIIDLLLHSSHPFHLSPMPLRTVSQVPGLTELDHLGNRQFHVSYFNSSAAALPFPHHDWPILLQNLLDPSTFLKSVVCSQTPEVQK